MKAKTVFKRAYLFDLDDTLIKSDAKSYVYRNGVYIKSLTPSEYNVYHKHLNDEIDFSEFENGQLILNAKKYKGWTVLKNVSNKIKREETTSEIFILTARHKVVKPFIYELLINNDIEIDQDHIITMGDAKGEIDVAEEKRIILQDLSQHYDEMFFFDDDVKNIELAASVPGVKPRLIKGNI